MRSLVKSRPEVGIWMEETTKPEIGPNDLLIRIRKTAICGTDIHIYNWDDWSQSNGPWGWSQATSLSGTWSRSALMWPASPSGIVSPERGISPAGTVETVALASGICVATP